MADVSLASLVPPNGKGVLFGDLTNTVRVVWDSAIAANKTWSSYDAGLYMAEPEYKLGAAQANIIQIPYSNKLIDLNLYAKNAGYPYPVMAETTITYHLFGYLWESIQRPGANLRGLLSQFDDFRGYVYDSVVSWRLQHARCSEVGHNYNPMTGFLTLDLTFAGKLEAVS